MGQRRRVFVSILAFALGLFVAGSVLWTVAARRTVREAVSPDGQRVAFVRAAPALDGPSQSLWLRSAGAGGAVRLASLSPDQNWCDEIFWSADGRQVGFLIRGYRVDVYHAARATLAGSWKLVEPDGYPGSREARGVSFLPDGSGVRFRVCPHRGGPCSPEREIRFHQAS